MANAYKILGQVTATANTLANVYVVPASTAAVVNSIHVTNLTPSTNISYSVAVVPSGAAISATTLPQYFVIRGAVVPPGDTAQLDFPITPHQAALCMALVKVSRLTESPDHYDSVKDFIAYGSIYWSVLEAVQDNDFEWKE